MAMAAGSFCNPGGPFRLLDIGIWEHQISNALCVNTMFSSAVPESRLASTWSNAGDSLTRSGLALALAGFDTAAMAVVVNWVTSSRSVAFSGDQHIRCRAERQ